MPSEPEFLDEQLAVILEALTIYRQRSRSYGEVWRQYGATANLLQAARKIDRLMQIWYHNPDGAEALQKDALDDAFDALNYLVFFIRAARDGNLTGEAPFRIAPLSCGCPMVPTIMPRPDCEVHGVEATQV